jgi:hypothetical protein
MIYPENQPPQMGVRRYMMMALPLAGIDPLTTLVEVVLERFCLFRRHAAETLFPNSIPLRSLLEVVSDDSRLLER